MLALRLTPFLPLHRRPHVRRIAAPPPAVFVPSISRPRCPVKAFSGLADAAISEVAGEELLFEETFLLKRTQAVEGKVSVRLRPRKDDKNRQLMVGCNLQGKWILHWGVTYADDVGSEWDQPPSEMRPPDTIPIKDYALETPMKLSSSPSESDLLYTFQIDISMDSSISAIHFVLKDEETGSWYQHRGRDFRVPLMQQYKEEDRDVGEKKSFSIWPGAFDHLSNILLNVEGPQIKDDDENGRTKNSKKQILAAEEVYEEYTIVKEELVQNVLTVSVRNSPEPHKALVHFNTDLPGDVTVHWGVSGQNDRKEWEIPPAPHPPRTKRFRKKALQTTLQQQGNGGGSLGSFALDKRLAGLLFVLKLNEYTWLNNTGNDFFIPLSDVSGKNFAEQGRENDSSKDSVGTQTSESAKSGNQATYTDGIISGIRNLASDLSSGKSSTLRDKDSQEKVLQEIEKLAAEAYSIFRGSTPSFVAETDVETEITQPPVKICSGTGSGNEILCQGFNWESHKCGRWYVELFDKVDKLSSLGVTVIWLPPPTESVSPEGYMPRDLYNLNSRYGTIEELKVLVNKLHDFGIKVLGDVVLNHRCAHYRNKNGVWNIFGGRLNWDDRAVVSDDPHFQGRGNRSSGDSFHAAPNIDHSQEFVRKDIKEWLGWLREEIGYDGWRLDFVRGFWGGYVKDYMEATEPYFAVGEYWDSLSYTYGNLDLNQDAHRQRIVDWINATNGTAGAFDVTTKGILHAALDKCEYWRLSDDKGKPPGVVGWWPSRAVTFIENHDTGSTQGHWRFPSGKELQGYAYILTHPGTPSVFFDHIFSGYESEISRLISLRHRSKLNCRSTVEIMKAERDVYGAVIDKKIAMKIGPGHFEPPSGPQKWSVEAEGRDYRVWESS